jgi:hypothetical protein
MLQQDPAVLADLSADLDRVVEVLREYMATPMTPWPDSPAARERAQQNDYTALPFDTPVVHAQAAPLQYIGVSADHLSAMAALIRTPGTVMALLTVLRTLIVGAAHATYVGDANVDLRERMRRTVNCELESLTERMRLIGRGSVERAGEYDRLDARRQDFKRAARTLGWTVNGNDTPKEKAWPKMWSIEPYRNEMNLVADLIGSVSEEGSPGITLYRYLSPTAHAQPHGLLALIVREHTTDNGDGLANAAIGMSHQHLLTLVMAALGSLTTAMDHCIRYYGWDPSGWTTQVVPRFNSIRHALCLPVPKTGIPRIG